MPTYTVKVTYKYSDTVTVEADSKEEAFSKAPEYANEQYESLYDCELIKETE